MTDAPRGGLKAEPRYSFAFAASEALRLFGFSLCRSQVRHWALREGLAKATPMRPTPFSRRCQRSRIGELWQMDATPYRWFGPDTPMMPMISMLDDCTRFQAGARSRACRSACCSTA